MCPSGNKIFNTNNHTRAEIQICFHFLIFSLQAGTVLVGHVIGSCLAIALIVITSLQDIGNNDGFNKVVRSQSNNAPQTCEAPALGGFHPNKQ